MATEKELWLDHFRKIQVRKLPDYTLRFTYVVHFPDGPKDMEILMGTKKARELVALIQEALQETVERPMFAKRTTVCALCLEPIPSGVPVKETEKGLVHHSC
mgnify:CR=1 FL=1